MFSLYLAASSSPQSILPSLHFRLAGCPDTGADVTCDFEMITVNVFGGLGRGLINPRIVREYLAAEAGRRHDGKRYAVSPSTVRRMKVELVAA